MARTSSSVALLALLALALAFVACSSSVEGEKRRYTAVKDRLEALGTKNPAMKSDIHVKLIEFDKEMREAEAKGGDAAIKGLQALVARMDSYEKNLNPQTPPPAGSGSSAPGGKLGSGQPPAQQPPPPKSPSGFGGK